MPALNDLKPTSLTARLRPLWPQIEQLLADGVQQAAIVEALRQEGFDLSLKTFRDYLYRRRNANTKDSQADHEHGRDRAHHAAPEQTRTAKGIC